MQGLNFKKILDTFKKVLGIKKEDVKKEEIELLKKKIRDDIQKGHDIKEIEKELNKRYPKSFVEFLLKDTVKREKTDVEWLKDYRKGIETKKESEYYQKLVNYIITSIFCAFVFYYSAKKLEGVFYFAIGFGGLFTGLIFAFKLAFWVSIAVFVVSLGMLTYKRYTIYKKVKKMFAENKSKDIHKEQEGEKKPKEQQVEKKPEGTYLAKSPRKSYSFAATRSKSLGKGYLLSQELEDKLRRISEGRL